MKIYVGQARGARLITQLSRYGWGEMVSRGELPPRRLPWAYDNGAFADWNHKDADGNPAPLPWNELQFLRDLETISLMDTRPDFIVCPDIVAGGLASLDFSILWMDTCETVAPVYLAVQDGMRPGHVGDIVRDFAGVFIGGTLEWKKKSSEEWIAWAHRHNRPVHIGRCGSGRKVRWARDIGADSIDSCLPLWSVGNLEAFRSEVQTPQRRLFAEQLGAAR